ncbi:MAG: hypothetical protein KDB71_08370 [Mycobacterium sp.]|nr:hypothetical protein [Mycobacterium sp.]
MGEPFIGSEALAQGMTWGDLQRNSARVFRDVYVPAGTEIGALVRARAAWLWSRRRGVIAGLGAAVLHGSKWIDQDVEVDLYHDNRHRLSGLHTGSSQLAGALAPDGCDLP